MSAQTLPKNNSENKNLYQCNATYFNPVNCKWIKGTFTLQRNHFEFVTDEPEQDTQFHLSLPLRTISSIKKRNSCLIYPSLVFQVGSEAHWFSSFPNRDSVYNLVELFCRNALLAPAQNPCITDSVDSKIVSPLGKKLLSILHESEETLVSTANMLDEQNQQLQEVQEYVTDFNSDLTVAEKILHSLPFASSASQSRPNGICSNNIKKPRIMKRKYKVTFTNCEEQSKNANDWEKGFFVISDDLKLFDSEENLKYHIPREEVSSIMIISPWEFSVNHIHDGKVTNYSIMCPMLSQLHKVLTSSPIFQEKVEYKDDCEDIFLASSSCSSMSTSSDTGSVSLPVICDPEVSQLGSSKIQTECTEKITDEEMQQISIVLNNLQTLATEVTKEKECQMEKINLLLGEVDKSEIRVNSDNRDMRKMN